METEPLTMVSTIDNPYNYFTQFPEWYAYDTARGYHTLNFLARVTWSSHELSDADQALAIATAVDEIVKENVLGLYIKVTAPAMTGV